MKKLFLIIFCLNLLFQAHAQRDQIYFDAFLENIIDTTDSPRPNTYYIVNLPENKLANHSIIRKLNNDYAIVKIGQNTHFADSKSYLKLNNIWKYATRLSGLKLPGKKTHMFSIKYNDDINGEFFKEYENLIVIRNIERAHISIVKSTPEYINSVIIEDDRIEFIDLVENKPKEESPIRQYNPELNKINFAKHNYPLVNGAGINISLKEHSIFEGDIDLLGKVLIDELSSDEFTQHAKEMGTLIAGRGNSFKTGEGVVTDAKLVCTSFNSLFAEDIYYYNSRNINIQNHSYGTGIENFYGNESISYDQVSVDRPGLIHVFSAGNSGDMAPENGNYQGISGFANLTGTFKQSKNALVIASLDSSGNHVSLSSSGPAYDGRLKPELSAFGGEGSSESAALVSGSIAMIQNHYKNLHNSNISSSLVRSLLIAAADDVHTKGIDFNTGFGSINLNRSLSLLDSSWHFESQVATNETLSAAITIPNNTHELKVVVSWIDQAAQPEDAIALVNDLDMVIKSPNNEDLLPWVLDHSPNVNTLSAPAKRSKDHLNNVEMISIIDPVEGAYTINIQANELQSDAQKFSVAYYIKMKGDFEWTFPTSSDQLEAGITSFLRWENTFFDESSNISIKYAQGNWEPIGQANLEKSGYKYTFKDTSTYAVLRMEISGEEFLSDTFTITPLPEIIVENDCAEDFVLSWDQIENAESYTLYALQTDIMIPIISTQDSTVVLDKSMNAASYYAVSPMLQNSKEGTRSFTRNYENSNKGCYISNFLAFMSVDQFANIQLSVNIPKEIQTISIIKSYQGKSEVFRHFSPGSESTFQFEDYDLTPGLLSYSSELHLINDEKIYSDTLSFYYTDNNTVIIFPNPIHDDYLNILNDYPGSTLKLLDGKGAFISQIELENTIDYLDLSTYRSGVYIFQIWHEGNMVSSGKIIRQ